MADEDTQPTAEHEIPEEDSIKETAADTPKVDDEVAAQSPTPKPKGKIGRLWQKYLARKKITIPATVLIFIVLLMAIPFTRYSILGLFIKQDFSASVTDSTTHKPISSVTINLAGASATTNSSGNATVKVKVGKSTLTASKKYYKNFSGSVTVALSKAKTPYQISMTATGRQVPIAVTNKITNKGLENATVKAADTEAQTDKDGNAILVLPADKDKEPATITAAGYNQTAVTVNVTDQKVVENNFPITPAGKVYFLSKASGKIDVVKTDLDGSNRQTVLAGTGKEEDAGTVLLASRDWKYLALLARRDSDKPKLYLIDTSTDKLTTMDEGDATFSLVGWDNSYFTYTVTRNKNVWEGKIYALKSFNAPTGQLKTLDESAGEGTGASDYAYESFGTVSIADSTLVYPKSWSAYYNTTNRLSGKQDTINAIKPDGTGKQVLKGFAVPTTNSYSYIDAHLYKPDEVYFQVSATDPTSYYEYNNGQLQTTTEVNSSNFNDPYPTYLISPDSNASFWSDPRDGKNTLFIGDKNGDSGKQIATLSEYIQYGWYTNDYLLVSKNSSELYIMPRDGGQPLKITDYHKPAQSFSNYGGGYGGF